MRSVFIACVLLICLGVTASPTEAQAPAQADTIVEESPTILGVRQLVDIHVVAVDRVQPADELKRRLPANTHERCFASDEA